MRVKFTSLKSELLVMTQIARRANTLAIVHGLPTVDIQDFVMDLDAVHSNGCRLDLQGLLTASEFDFTHDVAGIRQHLNRNNGKLLHFFDPRCVERKKVKA